VTAIRVIAPQSSAPPFVSLPLKPGHATEQSQSSQIRESMQRVASAVAPACAHAAGSVLGRAGEHSCAGDAAISMTLERADAPCRRSWPWQPTSNVQELSTESGARGRWTGGTMRAAACSGGRAMRRACTSCASRLPSASLSASPHTTGACAWHKGKECESSDGGLAAGEGSCPPLRGRALRSCTMDQPEVVVVSAKRVVLVVVEWSGVRVR
jgi:hypothetical protein